MDKCSSREEEAASLDPLCAGRPALGPGGSATPFSYGRPHCIDNAVTPSPADEVRMLLASAQAQLADAQRSIDFLKEIIAGMSGGGHSPADLIRVPAQRTVPRWHFPMLNDMERNTALAAALDRVVPPGSHVLDIGSGTGLLAMMAIRSGARHVTSCEANPLLAEIATQVIASHGMSDVITVIPKMSTELKVGFDIEKPADLIVAEIVDCGLIGEGLLPALRHARSELLVPGGILVPGRGRVIGVLLDSPAVEKLNHVATAAGFDIRKLNWLATHGHFPVRLNTWPHRVLSAPAELAAFDLVNDPLMGGEATVTLPVVASGLAHGIVAWFEIELGAGVVLQNSPDNAASHWMQAFIPFCAAVPVTAGSLVEIGLRWSDRSFTAYHTEPPGRS
jgi:arginine Nomega-methyltransferase